MRVWIVLLVVASLFPAIVPAEDNRPVVLVLGDSLSAAYDMPVEQGWPALLEDRLETAGFPHGVVNASVSGETTGGGVSRLPRLLANHEPAIVIIALGGNDGLRHTAPEQIEANLATMLEAAGDANTRVLLAAVRLPPNYGRHYLDEYEAVFPEVAHRFDAAYVPRMLDGVAGDDALMGTDGIHPTADAQSRILENVWPALEPLLDTP